MSRASPSGLCRALSVAGSSSVRTFYFLSIHFISYCVSLCYGDGQNKVNNLKKDLRFPADKFMAQLMRASLSGLCRVECHRFDFRSLPDTFFQYHLPLHKYQFALLFCHLVVHRCLPIYISPKKVRKPLTFFFEKKKKPKTHSLMIT